MGRPLACGTQKFQGIIPEVTRRNPRVAAINLWGPMMAVVEESGLAREYRELIDGPEAVVEILATITVGERG